MTSILVLVHFDDLKKDSLEHSSELDYLMYFRNFNYSA